MKDLFPGYYKPSDAEFEQLWQTCVFSFDANVLLKLFRVSKPTREFMLTVLRRLEDRIWLPYQYALEYHSNRLTVMREQEAALQLEKLGFNEFKKKVQLYKGIDHPLHNYEELQKIVDTAESALKDLIAGAGLEEYKADCDCLIEELAQLFSGRVGAKYDDNVFKTKVEDAKIRFEKKLPPGFLDANQKGEPERYGDAIGWFQLLDYAGAEEKNVILVTDEADIDWWWREDGKTIGPPRNMVAEMAAINSKFYLYSSKQFLVRVEDFLSLKAANIEAMATEMDKSNDGGFIALNEYLSYTANAWFPNELLSSSEWKQPTLEFINSLLTFLCKVYDVRSSDPYTDIDVLESIGIFTRSESRLFTEFYDVLFDIRADSEPDMREPAKHLIEQLGIRWFRRIRDLQLAQSSD